MSDELKPVRCGCGGEAFIGYTESGLCYVECKNCEIETIFYRDVSTAVRTWNKAMGERTAKVKWASTYGEIMEYRFDGICKCGTEVDKMWEYCPSCGARLE